MAKIQGETAAIIITNISIQMTMHGRRTVKTFLVIKINIALT